MKLTPYLLTKQGHRLLSRITSYNVCYTKLLRNGHRVTLFERNEKLGKKLYITGKGRCNVTNMAERDAFFEHVLRNPRFLYSAFSHFDNKALMERRNNFV